MIVNFSLWLTFAVQVRDINFCSTCGYSAWPSPTLMGWVLLGPIRNRVEYGFFFFLNSKRVRVLSKKSKTRPGYNLVTLKLQKTPIYIAITNPKSLIFSVAAHTSLSPSSPSFPYFSSRLPQSSPTLTHSLSSPLTTTAITEPHLLSFLLTTTAPTKPRKPVHKRCRCSIIRWTFRTQHFLHPLIETPTVPQRN